MEQEEHGLGVVKTAQDIPESSRVRQSMLVPRKGEKPVAIYRRQREGSSESWVLFDAATGTEYEPDPGEFECNASQWKLYILAASQDQ